MKIKNLISILSIFTLAFFNAAFVNPDLAISEKPEITKRSFIEFLSLFEKTDMPFKVGLDDFEKYHAKINQPSRLTKKTKSKKRSSEQLIQQYLTDNARKMISRMGPPRMMPVARFYPNDQMVAVVFISYQPNFGSKNLSFALTLFDLKGNKIPNTENLSSYSDYTFSLGYTAPYSNTQTFSINEDGYIWTRNYKALWEKDVKEHGVNDNKIVGYELEDIQVFQIKEDGVIAEAKDYPVADRASL